MSEKTANVLTTLALLLVVGFFSLIIILCWKVVLPWLLAAMITGIMALAICWLIDGPTIFCKN